MSEGVRSLAISTTNGTTRTWDGYQLPLLPSITIRPSTSLLLSAGVGAAASGRTIIAFSTTNGSATLSGDSGAHSLAVSTTNGATGMAISTTNGKTILAEGAA